MKYRQIGDTGIKISEISLGCWTLGGLNWINGTPNGWANVDEAEVQKAVDLALEKGVNHFDNADAYGNGRAERMLARVLGKRTKDVVIATKTGHFPGTAEYAYDPLHIRHQCEQSLRNLNRDHADIYYFHHGNFGENDKYLDDALDMMHRLRDEGKFRVLGLSTYSIADFTRLVPKINPQILQGRASMLDDQFIRADSPVRKLMEARNIGLVAFSPLGQGKLLGKYSAKNPPQFEDGDTRRTSGRFTAEALVAMEPKLEALKSRFGAGVPELARAALLFLLKHRTVACVIPGFRNLNQVRVNLGAADQEMTDADYEFVLDLFKDRTVTA